MKDVKADLLHIHRTFIVWDLLSPMFGNIRIYNTICGFYHKTEVTNEQ